MKCRLYIGIAVLIILWTIYPLKNAHSYLDLGSGSYMIQVLAAALFGSMFTVKLYWKKIRSVFRKDSVREEKIE